MELLDLKLIPPNSEFSKTELDIIAIHLTDPTVRKYLNNLLWNCITDAANIPLVQLATELQAYAIKQAFIKGSVGCLTDLLSIEKAPTRIQTPKE